MVRFYQRGRWAVLVISYILFLPVAQAQAAEVSTDSVRVDTAVGEQEPETDSGKMSRHVRQQWRPVQAEPQLQHARQRRFDREKLNEYANNSDYQYDLNQPSDRLSWWQRFKMWLYDKLAQMFESVPGGQNTRNRILLIIAGALLVYAILKFIGADPRSLFSRKAKANQVSLEEAEADIHTISFDDMIADAISKQQYKRAVRLFYLKSLKLLSDREWIDWQPYKTNYEYVRELKQNELSADFRQATYVFEYIWYGDFQLDQAAFAEIEKRFRDFEQELKMI